MSEKQMTVYENADEITERVMALLAPTTPVWVEQENGDHLYSDEAQTVFESVLGVLEGDEVQS